MIGRRRVVRGVAHPLLWLSFLAAMHACVYPATEVEVRVDTDIDPHLPLVLTVRVTYGADANADLLGHTWQRAEASDARTDTASMTLPMADGGAAAFVSFPFRFLVIPGDGPHDAHVQLRLEAQVDGVVVRREAAFSFIPREHTVLPLFLAARCALPSTQPCATVNPCSESTYCEEHGQTCGNDGRCTAIETVPTASLDASFGDMNQPLPACGAYAQGCCLIGPSCDASLACVAGRCQRCLDTTELCCQGANLLADGTACGVAGDTCHVPGVCTAGVCGMAQAAPDGTPCGTPVTCHHGSTCVGGTCTPGSASPDGTAWGSGGAQRCCGGSPVSLDSASNCNACGLACASGTCAFHPSVGQYLCACSGSNAECSPLICRSTAYPDGHTCIPSDGRGNCVATCPGGSTCHTAHLASQPNYCYYP